jgi:hypothetical protein
VSIRRANDGHKKISSIGGQSFAMIAGQAKPGKIQRANEAILRDLSRRQSLAGFASDFSHEGLHGLPIVQTLGEDTGCYIAPVMKSFAVPGNMPRRMVGKAEVSKEETARLQFLDSIEGGIPLLQLNIGGRGGRKVEGMAFDADARVIADKGNPARGLKESDVVGRMTRGVEHSQFPRAKGEGFAALQHMEIVFGNRKENAKQTLHVVPVESLGACQEDGWVGQVTCAARVNINLQMGILPEKRAGRAGMIEVDVREENRLKTRNGAMVDGELCTKRVKSRSRSRIDERAELAGTQKRGSDGARKALPA